ncbi:MAG: hypothetical protein ACRDR6_19715 [Pseudonocardiaceae bacterium]
MPIEESDDDRMDTHDLLVAIVGAVVGLLLQGSVGAVIALRQFHGKEFSGVRYLILPPSGGKSERIDRYRIRQSGQNLAASISRIAPPEEAKRRWKMVGYSHGNILVGVFYPISRKSDSSSYGALVLHRDPDIKECGVWRGYYVRPDLYGLTGIIRADVARHPAVLQEWNPQIRNFSHKVTP